MSLKYNTLTDLNLTDNRIGDSGASQIANSLQHNYSLTVIKLGGNSIASKILDTIETTLSILPLKKSVLEMLCVTKNILPKEMRGLIVQTMVSIFRKQEIIPKSRERMMFSKGHNNTRYLYQ